MRKHLKKSSSAFLFCFTISSTYSILSADPWMMLNLLCIKFIASTSSSYLTFPPLFGNLKMLATESVVTRILPRHGRTSSEVSGSKQCSSSHLVNLAGIVEHWICSSPSKLISRIILRWGPVNSSYNLTSLAGDALFLRDCTHLTWKNIYKKWEKLPNLMGEFG